MLPENPDELPLLSGVGPPISRSLHADSANISLPEAFAIEIRPRRQATPDDAVNAVSVALNEYSGKETTDSEDRIFHEHGLLIRSHLRTGDLRQVCSLWETRIEPLVSARERVIGKPIHKGAPLYNTGLAFFVSGDFDSALRYFIAADEEDMRNKGAHSFRVVIGDHPLSGQVLIDPLVETLVPHWANSYGDIVGCALTADEIKGVLGWLASAPMDAVQAIIALHRFQRSLQGLENPGSQHLRIRAIADLLVVLESNLKKRFSPTTKMLGGLLKDVLQGKPPLTCYDNLNAHFDATFPFRTNDRHSPAATNWIVARAIYDIASSAARAEKIGYVCSLAQHLRNGLMHSIEPSLTIYAQRSLAIEVAGLAFSALRIVKHGADNTL